ncbi:Pro-resilin, partial [Harpegnathos saltator]
ALTRPVPPYFQEPAKYEFSYEVKDEQSGSDYGHTETRDGDRAQGEFNVLLPDGRKQIVEYEADQDGFKPQIRYEGEASTGGYGGGGGSNGNDGY